MFTPWPYQIELVNCALKRNTIACLNSASVKYFVWMTYLKEILGHNHRAVHADGKETNAFVLFNSDHQVREYGINLNTHLDMQATSVLTENGRSMDKCGWDEVLSSTKIVVTTPEVLASALANLHFDASLVSVLVLDECHNVIQEDSDYRRIVTTFKEHDCKPYILGLTCSLLKEDSPAAKLDQDIRLMENLLGCKAETATDLIALDGCSPTQPDEKIVMCGSRRNTEYGNKPFNAEKLSSEIRDILVSAIDWLKVCEITSSTNVTKVEASAEHGDEDKAKEENSRSSTLLTVENPDNEISNEATVGKAQEESDASSASSNIDVDGLVTMSLTVLSQVLLVLDVLGLWCAHRLVILLLKQLQKSIRLQETIDTFTENSKKWKFFLLRFTDSHLRTVYTLCQSHIGHQKKVDLQLVTPKVDRLLQVLKEYKPPPEPEKKDNLKTSKHNDRSESGYVSWWQDSDAEEDEEEEQMMNQGKDKDSDEQDDGSKSGRARARQYHHANSLCGIVFVKDKHVALMLQRLLKEVSKEDSDLWHIASAHITSLATSDSNNEIFGKPDVSQDMYNNPTNTERLKQEEVLRSFRSHEINLLVSTNCLEEYAEIPKCNLVLRFDVPTTYKSYILSKSRVRATNSTYMMLVHEREKADFLLRLKEYKKIEKVLQTSTQLKQQMEGTAPDDYLAVMGHNDADNEIVLSRAPPYFTGPNTCVTLDSAIHVVNRYCSRLPSDPFTHLSPRCEIVQELGDVDSLNDPLFNASIDKSYRGILQLPINSQVRNVIKGAIMPTDLLAQKAVALEACKVLHKARELDDHFMPIGKEMVKYAEELYSWPEEKSKIPGRPGTTKRRQTYDKEVPSVLSGCLPQPDIPLFLYEIEMTLRTRLPETLNVRRRTLHAPEETTRCFGILTAKPLPSVLGFPIFTRSGEESVRIKSCRSFITLGKHHIKMIRSFHNYIFSDMLRIERVPLAFSPDISAMQIFIVILDKATPDADLDIDWPFMCKVASKRRIEERMRSDPWFRHKLLEAKGGKKSFVFKRYKYEDGVVIAKYRSPDQPNRFYVAEIKNDLNPYSRFPSTEYESFHHYYKIKYGLDIRCLNQPLLDVDHTSSRLNLLTPRYMNQKGKALPVTSLEKKRAKYETLTNRQILVPELCDLHPIPASLWRKAVCIPSIIHRLSSILLADELRKTINEDSKIGIPEFKFCEDWPDLDFGWDNEQSNHENGESMTSSVTETSQGDYDRSGKHTMESLGESEHALKTIENGNDVGSENEQNWENSDCLETSESTENSIEESKCPSEVAENGNNLSRQHDETKGNLPDVNHTEQNSNGQMKDKNDDSDESDLDCDYDTDDFQLSLEPKAREENPKSLKLRTKKTLKSRIPSRNYAVIPRAAVLASNQGEGGVSRTEKLGPSPGLILQALTLSNASDGFNLERLEMLGDSFLKHAVTVYLFCTYPEAHEGKLSYMRSKKVSNYNLYRIGQQRNLPGKMTAHIFDPAVNWLPPGYVIGNGKSTNEDDITFKNSQFDDLDDEMEIGVWTGVPGQKQISPKPAEKTPEKNERKPPMPRSHRVNDMVEDEEEEEIFDEDEIQMIDNMLGGCLVGGMDGLRGSSHDRKHNDFPTTFTGRFVDRSAIIRNETQHQRNPDEFVIDTWTPVDSDGKPLCSTDPLIIDLHTQHSLADKSIADCVEAIVGAYLTTCGHRAAQLLLCYFGLKVLPRSLVANEEFQNGPLYGFLMPPTNVLLDDSPAGYRKLSLFTKDLQAFEEKINYTFKNKAYLLQAFTHASYYLNTITDCYQRLEFLGDAVLDFLITCQLFNDPTKRHSPGALTDLRSALVNNTIFASLAVRHDFHKYFKAISLEMHHIIDGFVRYQHLQEDAQGMDAQLAKKYYPATEDTGDNDLKDIIVAPDAFTDPDDGEEEEEEDVEVPKALGDIFESVAGAIYMDSGMNLDEVWRVYEPMMGPLIEKFSSCVPRAPVRELLEMEPETAKFSWAEKRCDGKVRVTVEVIGKGSFKGVGRSYRIAKSAAARRALRFLKSQSSE